MRGTPREVYAVPSMVGIIPAYAGNTDASGRLFVQFRDHPRVGGEHLLVLLISACALGSSPRMRGTLGALLAVQLDIGIIPAYAGNTW